MKKTNAGYMRRILCLLTAALVLVSLLSGCSSNAKGYDYQFSDPEKGDTIAVFHTSMGDITVRFFPEEAPKAVENFVTHAQEGYFDGMEWFRVMDYFIQSGDPTGSGDGGESIWKEPFEDEIVDYLSPYCGALCMANYGAFTGTNNSQFFIVTSKDTDISMAEAANELAPKDMQIAKEKLDNYASVGGAIWLDAQVGSLYETNYSYKQTAHTVFGQVIDGMDVAIAISKVKTYTKTQENDATIDNPNQTAIKENKPVEPVLINSVEIRTYE